MSESASAPRAPKVAASERTAFDATAAIEATHTAELVIALCGPIGSPIHRAAQAIKERLEEDFAYEPREIIRLSKLIERYGKKAPQQKGYERKRALIEAGDQLREDYGPGVLAELAINEIAIERDIAREKSGKGVHSPRRVCHIIDSIKNQQELDVLKLVYRDMLYFVGVYSPLPARVKSLEHDGQTQTEIFSLIDRDSGEELMIINRDTGKEIKAGQTVQETFPQADFFLRIDTDTDMQIRTRVERFLQLILGTRIWTPTLAETAMYAAASAAGNSACLSRQVGAALCDKNGEVISVGWNDVPRFNGGLYTADPKADPSSETDKRCWNLDGGACFNDQEKKLLSTLLISELIKNGVVSEENRDKATGVVIGSKKIKSLIEFSRSIHAEMQAILAAGRTAGEKIKGGKLFCTTYPCHSCARHIVAAGISEVYYIEPYRKSLATKLHSDSITEEESAERKVRVLPYDGVAPSRYLKLFRVPQDSRKDGDGHMTKTNPKIATPRFDKTLAALPELEAFVVKGLRDKKIFDATGVRKEANDA
jgi:deoxycytidylate deaminase